MKKLRISGSVTWNLFLLFLVFALVGTVFVGSVGAGYFASLVKKNRYAQNKSCVIKFLAMRKPVRFILPTIFILGNYGQI